jgi:hypothetical protein
VLIVLNKQCVTDKGDDWRLHLSHFQSVVSDAIQAK